MLRLPSVEWRSSVLQGSSEIPPKTYFGLSGSVFCSTLFAAFLVA
jgi:hypothetical protein